MTTVLIDFKNQKVVADKQTTLSYNKYNALLDSYSKMDWTFGIENSYKLNKLGECVVVGAGSKSEINRQIDSWKNNGYIFKPKDKVTIAIVYTKDDGLLVDLYNAVKTWCGYKWEKSITQGNSKVITFGSGSSYAYGAFMGGLSAEDSIVAASKCDIYTSCEYDVVELGGE